MSELPEKKVLKEMLVKLKAKVLDSLKEFYAMTIMMNTNMQESLKKSLEKVLEMPQGEGQTNALLLLSLFQMWNQSFDSFNARIRSLIGDMNLYIETLEKYSTELDGTLTEIFESAKKRAEEIQKQQEALRNKKPSYMA